MRRLISVTTLIAVICFTASCGKDEAVTKTTPSKKPEKADTSPIKFGVILPLSGPLVSYGKYTLDGIKLRVDQINENGGINKRKIQLIIEDNKGDSTESRNAFKKLAATDKVSAIIGPITSTNALSIRRDAAELKVPVISPTATNDKVTKRNQYVFKACFNDSFQGKAVAEYCIKDLKLKNAATMTDMNSDYSKGLSKSFKKYFTALGGKIVADEGYQQKDTDFSSQMKKIKSAGAQIIFVPGYPPEVPLIIKQAKVIGIKSRLCGGDGWDNSVVIDKSGDNIINCFYLAAFYPKEKRKAVSDFISAYLENYSDKPGSFPALGFDSVSLLEKAIIENGSSPEDIKDGLLKIKNLECVTGKMNVTSEGDVAKSAVILEVKKDADEYVSELVKTVEP